MIPGGHFPMVCGMLQYLGDKGAFGPGVEAAVHTDCRIEVFREGRHVGTIPWRRACWATAAGNEAMRLLVTTCPDDARVRSALEAAP